MWSYNMKGIVPEGNEQMENKNEVITKYANEIPLIARKMISGLDDDVNWAILMILKKFGDSSFSDLEKITTLRKSSLNYHIKKLLDSALIENYYQKKKGREEYSFYELTLLALNLLDSIENLIEPSKNLISLVSEPKFEPSEDLLNRMVYPPIKNAAAIKIEPDEIDENLFIYNEFYNKFKFNSENIQDLHFDDVKERILERPRLNKKIVPYNFGTPQVNIINVKIENAYAKEKEEISPKKVVIEPKNTEIYKRC